MNVLYPIKVIRNLAILVSKRINYRGLHMKKFKVLLFSLVFIFSMFLSSNLETAFAAVGDRTTPYSAWDNHRFTFQEYAWETPKVIELQFIDMYRGDDANYIVEQENMFNEVPAYDEEWLLMGFNLKYVSGPEEPLNASDVIWSGKSFYTKDGQKISPISTASFSNILSGYGEYDVELYPGGRSEVYYGILVKKTVGFPIVKVGAGVNSSTYQTNYKWFSTDPNYYEPVPLPTSVKTASTYNSVNLSWSAASGVSGYEIYRSTSSTGTYTKIATTSSTSYTNTSLNTGTTYYYKIRAYKSGTPTTFSSFSPVVSAKPSISIPTSVKAVSSSYNSIKTSWAAVSGASGYEIYRATSSTGSYSRVGTTTSTSFTNSSLSTNTPYYYKVRTYRNVGSSKVYSNFSSIISAKPIPSVPTSFKASRLSSTSLKLTWSSVTGASGYQLYRSTSSTGTYSLLKDLTSLSYTNSGLITGKKYYYKMRSYRTVGNIKVYSGWTSIISATP
jgi:fibronectin type 3 domain-containing protein